MWSIIIVAAVLYFISIPMGGSAEILKLAVIGIIGICFCFSGVKVKLRRFLGTYSAINIFLFILSKLNIIFMNDFQGQSVSSYAGVLVFSLMIILMLVINKHYKRSTRLYSFTVILYMVCNILATVQNNLIINREGFDVIDLVWVPAAVLIASAFIALLVIKKHPVLFLIISSSVCGAMIIGDVLYAGFGSGVLGFVGYETTYSGAVMTHSVMQIAAVLIFGMIGFFVQRVAAKKMPVCDGSDYYLTMIRNSEKMRKETRRVYKEGKYAACAAALRVLVEFNERLLSEWRKVRSDRLIVYMRRELEDFALLMNCYCRVDGSTQPMDKSPFFYEEFNGHKERLERNILKEFSEKEKDEVNKKLDYNYALYRGLYSIENGMIFCRFCLRFPGVFNAKSIKEEYDNELELMNAMDKLLANIKFNPKEMANVITVPNKQTMKWYSSVKKSLEELRFSVYMAGN